MAVTAKYAIELWFSTNDVNVLMLRYFNGRVTAAAQPRRDGFFVDLPPSLDLIHKWIEVVNRETGEPITTGPAGQEEYNVIAAGGKATFKFKSSTDTLDVGITWTKSDDSLVTQPRGAFDIPWKEFLYLQDSLHRYIAFVERLRN